MRYIEPEKGVKIKTLKNDQTIFGNGLFFWKWFVRFVQ